MIDNKWIFTFLVEVEYPYYFDKLMCHISDDYDKHGVLVCYGKVHENLYRVFTVDATRSKVDKLCSFLSGFAIRQLDWYTAKCLLEIEDI